jgi:integrase/recombinase XerD
MKAKKYLAKLYAFKKNITKNGEVALYISVTINRKNKFIPLKLYWPAEAYDFAKQEIKKQSPKDAKYRDYSLIINKSLSICNEIFVQYRLRDEDLAMEVFLNEFYQFNLRKDFKSYMESKVKLRYRRKEISQQTKKNHLNTVEKLKAKYNGPVNFTDINVKWCRDFENHLRKGLKLKISTVWSHMKDINTYLNLAMVEDNIPVVNPFSNGYHYSPGKSEIDALSMEELKRLTEYYHSDKIPANQKYVLCQFLFSCYTGLRISDLKTISRDNIIGDVLVFHPVKSRRFDKILRIPLSKKAKSFISEELTGKIFEKYVDQASNRILKKIEEECKIGFRLTNHTGRHSFATLFLELGGSVEVLQKLMGHSKITTTMKYVHIQEKRKEEQMGNFDKLDF